MTSGPERRAFVIGQPIAHSRSPIIHGQWLREHGIAGSYERKEVAPADLAGFLRDFGRLGYIGGNVTVPHKEAALLLVDEATPNARRLGAVNTLWRDEEGRLWGDNTDGTGFLANLDERAPGWNRGAPRTLVLGAGGAARAIVPVLLGRDVGQVLLANRTEGRARELAGDVSGSVQVLGWAEIDRALSAVDLIVNTTQLGMKGQPPLALAIDRLPAHAIVADIVYVPLETPLLAAARARGLRAVDGLGMLLHQAVPGFARWFGVTPAVTPALRALVEADIGRAA